VRSGQIFEIGGNAGGCLPMEWVHTTPATTGVQAMPLSLFLIMLRF
jgi:hypothetical protein